LRAAGTVFADRGYHGATLDDVLAEAGVSRGALYHYFCSKQELFLALLNERMTTGIEDAAAVFNQLGAGEDARIAAVSGFLDRFERNPRWLPLLLEFLAIGCRDTEVRAGVVNSFLRPAREQTAALIRRTEDDTTPPGTLTADELATAATALINGLAIERAFDPDAVPSDLPGRLLTALGHGATEPARRG
jgi:AcrR family transcriptional regulator